MVSTAIIEIRINDYQKGHTDISINAGSQVEQMMISYQLIQAAFKVAKNAYPDFDKTHRLKGRLDEIFQN